MKNRYPIIRRDGKAFNRTLRFTRTWVERNSKWKCVAEQVAGK